jgi:hypothetical protein
MFEKIASGAGEVPLYEARHFSAVGQSAASPVGRFLLNLRYSFQKMDARCCSRAAAESPMCRNIKTLFNFEPPATELEIRDASLQFVRKLSGFNVPSKANQAAFDRAVEDIAAATRVLIGSLVTTADPRDREIEVERARARSAMRFGQSQ